MRKIQFTWKRVWAILVALSAINIFVTSIIEFRNPRPSRYISSGTFITYGIPPGTGIGSDHVTFPDGTIFPIHQINPRTGKAPDPWEIDWSKELQIPKRKYINWASIGFNLIVVPSVLWLLMWSIFKLILFFKKRVQRPVHA